MQNTAMFHRLGTLDRTDVYLEKYSRSLICLGEQGAQHLTGDCDRDVTVSDGVWSFLCNSRISRKHLRSAAETASRKVPGVELTLITTNRCNFACSYCFANNLYLGSKTLNAAEIVHYLKEFLHLSRTAVSSLIFFGGEPLLAFEAIKQAWEEIRELFVGHQGGMPSLAMVTNGSLVNRDIAEFLADNDVAVTVSLDGPKVVHDACRPLPQGKASYERVVKGINELERAGVFYAIEGTYTSKHLGMGIDVIEVVDHALGLNAQEVHVMPAFPEQASGIGVSNNTHVAGMFKAAAARATNRYLASGAAELAYASRLAYAFAHDRRRRYICTAGLDKFTIMVNGDVVPCYLVCNSAHKIVSCRESKKTNAKRLSFERAVVKYQALTREYFPECSRCWASDWCFACYGPGYARQSRLGAPGGLECEIYQAMTEATLLECARFLSDQ